MAISAKLVDLIAHGRARTSSFGNSVVVVSPLVAIQNMTAKVKISNDCVRTQERTGGRTDRLPDFIDL